MNIQTDITEYRAALDRFAGKRVLVIGDLMLDEHIWGTAERISPEAPVMVVNVDSAEPDYRPGGAANVANNLRALGAEASVIGVVGDDEGGRELVRLLAKEGIDVSGVFVDKHRPTTRKTRVWASHRHQVVRVDRESRRHIPQSVIDRVVEHIRREVQGADAALLSDYDKGVITKETARAAIQAASDLGKVSVSNPKPRNLSHFAGIGAITLNQSEASAASHVEIHDIRDVEKAGMRLLGATRCRGLVITRGAHGLSVFTESRDVRHVSAVESEVYDVAGAGDTVISALTLALACGLDLAAAGTIANCAGGAVVRKIGVATTSVEEIAAILQFLCNQQGMQPQRV